MEGVDSLQGTEMSDRAAASMLRERGVGVLSLARGCEAYAVPISFGYADGPRRVFFDLLRFGEDSLKADFVDSTETACLVTYEADSRFDWRSVVVRGPIRRARGDEREEMAAAMDDNAWFPSLFPPDEPMTGVRRSVLAVRELSGRRGESEPG